MTASDSVFLLGWFARVVGKLTGSRAIWTLDSRSRVLPPDDPPYLIGAVLLSRGQSRSRCGLLCATDQRSM